MRLKLKPWPTDGQTRQRTVFAWFPYLGGNEFRWLERVTVLERYYDSGPGDPGGWYFSKFL